MNIEVITKELVLRIRGFAQCEEYLILVMATSVQISYINKNDRSSAYERIAFIRGIHHGSRWKLSLTDAIRDIENGTYSFYTSVNGHVRNVIVATRLGTK